jgi:hypothetical protein
LRHAKANARCNESTNSQNGQRLKESKSRCPVLPLGLLDLHLEEFLLLLLD